MNVLVVGSLHFADSVKVREEFLQAAQEIGKTLAQRRHTIIVGSDSPNTADAYVVQGANAVTKRAPHPVQLYIPEEQPKIPFYDRRAQFPRIHFSSRRIKGP